MLIRTLNFKLILSDRNDMSQISNITFNFN